jgi:hypothetical protein
MPGQGVVLSVLIVAGVQRIRAKPAGKNNDLHDAFGPHYDAIELEWPFAPATIPWLTQRVPPRLCSGTI